MSATTTARKRGRKRAKPQRKRAKRRPTTVVSCYKAEVARLSRQMGGLTRFLPKKRPGGKWRKTNARDVYEVDRKRFDAEVNARRIAGSTAAVAKREAVEIAKKLCRPYREGKKEWRKCTAYNQWLSPDGKWLLTERNGRVVRDGPAPKKLPAGCGKWGGSGRNR